LAICRLGELNNGFSSGDEQGWISASDVKKSILQKEVKGCKI
jgi:hypothetical protein